MDYNIVSHPGRSLGSSLAWDLDSRRPRGGGGRNAASAAAHLSLGPARPVCTGGTCLACGGPSLAWRTSRGARAATAAGAQRRFISRLVRASPPFRVAPRAKNGGPSIAWRPESLRLRGGAAEAQRRLISRVATYSRAFAAGPGRPEDSK
eukprot:tig00020597_g11704.t1